MAKKLLQHQYRSKDAVKFLLEMNEPASEKKKKMLEKIKKKHKSFF